MSNAKRTAGDKDDVRTAPESGDAETEVRDEESGLNAQHVKEADDERDMEKLDPDHGQRKD